MTLFVTITACCSWIFRIVASWFDWLKSAPPEPFVAKIKRTADTWAAGVNQRRMRKPQRKAASSGDRFAFA